MLFAFYSFQVVFEILYVSLFFTSWADSKLAVKKSELKVCVNIKSLEFDLHFFYLNKRNEKKITELKTAKRTYKFFKRY